MSAAPLCAPPGALTGPTPIPGAGPGVENGPLGPFLHVHHPGGPETEGTPVPYPAYRLHLQDLARRRRGVGEALGELVVHGARSAADQLREHRQAVGGPGGHVCAAVPVPLAHEPLAVLAGARALHRAVDRPNLMITVPATARGLQAITGCLSEGIGVHAVCVVSVERYARVVDAFLTGLERAARAGLDLGAVPTALSLAVAGLDAAAGASGGAPAGGPVPGGARAGSAGTGRRVPGGLAAATVDAALRIREQVLEGKRWRALARQGARPHPLRWDGIHAQPGGRPAGGDGARAWRVLGALAEQGICYGELTARAEAAALAGSARRQRHTAQLVGAALRAAAPPAADGGSTAAAPR
ncbi:transaldolase family protein [Streptomyces europaeiscabiei]|uniref:Transaldolase family protein n=1 Tax=Streptomyces europaeiscabiei TaxID=146819 RepID=A0AAJ2PWZ8_9ACTN|nr:transaldolase family protein [Streptomyces europaeiscabiei]MDX3134967.1 transaldolase family protein [Streptomyces europaeiscabiei]